MIRHAAAGTHPTGPPWDGTGWYDDESVRTGEGWRIAKRACKVVLATGNPGVQELYEGVKFELVPASLREEDKAGRVAFLREFS
jgi:hypothetical protein